jgi:hypothetical protein
LGLRTAKRGNHQAWKELFEDSRHLTRDPRFFVSAQVELIQRHL